MAKNAKSSGKKMNAVAPSGGVVSGQLVKIGDIWMVASQDAAVGEKFVGNLDGEYDLTADTGAGSGGAQGAKMYAIPASGNVTADPTGNELVGVAAEASADGDATKNVRLSGIPV